MTIKDFEEAQRLISDINAINSIISCLENNHKDACEINLYNVIYKNKNRFIQHFKEIKTALEIELEQL